MVKKRAKMGGQTTIAYVRWFDSAIYKGDPCQPDQLTGTTENESAGILVSEDDNTITIALDRCLDTKDVRLVLCVPKANILSIRRFRASPTCSSSGVASSPATSPRRRPS